MIADEIGGYLNVAVVYLGLAYTLKEGGFIRVELLYQKLTGAARVAANWVILVASFAFVVATLIAMTRSVLYVYDQGIRSTDFTQTPLFLPQSLILIGLLLLALQLFAFALERARTLP
jgi:TRAP-type mannitol/chloroaromatic compound transport system permease small subunit